jgi:hypothetical protein
LISPNAAKTVVTGSALLFTATPNTGYGVSGWLLDGNIVQAGKTTYTLSNIAANHTVQVRFGVQTFSVTPTAGANGLISPNAAKRVVYGSALLFTATPGSGYVVTDWSVDGNIVQTGKMTYTLSNITADHTVFVTFNPLSCNITPSAGANGNISPNTAQTVPAGTSLSFTATPNTGYGISGWLLDGNIVQVGGSTYTLNNIIADHTVLVKYGVLTYTVVPSTDGNGTVSPSAAKTVTYGAAILYTAVPSTGYSVGIWALDGALVQTGGTTYTLRNITTNHSISVTFNSVTTSSRGTQ